MGNLLLLLLDLLQVLVLHSLHLFRKAFLGKLCLLLKHLLDTLQLCSILVRLRLRFGLLALELILRLLLLLLRFRLLFLEESFCSPRLALQLDVLGFQSRSRLALGGKLGSEALDLLFPDGLVLELLLVSHLLLLQLVLHLFFLGLLRLDLTVELRDLLLHVRELTVCLLHLCRHRASLLSLILRALLFLLPLNGQLRDTGVKVGFLLPGLLDLLVHGGEEGLDALGLLCRLLHLKSVGLVHVRHHLFQVLAPLFELLYVL
mmetsp:Transcript_40022/g.95570  ORF Transcript_40022/g.95570 Transcript_40022/m.95570 type:complete len:261 (-) Transcript_40022:880-1662(-)